MKTTVPVLGALAGAAAVAGLPANAPAAGAKLPWLPGSYKACPRDSGSEACLGTAIFCGEEGRRSRDGYGSAGDCFADRQPGPRPWTEPQPGPEPAPAPAPQRNPFFPPPNSRPNGRPNNPFLSPRPQPQPQPQPQPEHRPEPQPEPQPGRQPDHQNNPFLSPQPEPQPEPQPGHQPDPQPAPAPSAKKPWVYGTRYDCFFVDFPESCVGTESFCRTAAYRQREGYNTEDDCLAARKPQPAPKPWVEGSRECPSGVTNEACLGTREFCQDEAARRLGNYFSQEECFADHEPEPRGKA